MSGVMSSGRCCPYFSTGRAPRLLGAVSWSLSRPSPWQPTPTARSPPHFAACKRNTCAASRCQQTSTSSAHQEAAARAPTEQQSSSVGHQGNPLKEAVGYLGLLLAACPAACATEAVAYNPEGGSEAFKTLAGVAYIALVIFYFFRLFRKRAQTATSQPLASTLTSKDATEDDSDGEVEELPQPPPKATPLAAFIGAAQAGVICYLLFQLTQGVDGYFANKALPEQYTAHNVAVLVQTVVRGLAYLITFIFGANALGLTGLTIQLLLFPELDDDRTSRRQQEPVEKLPDVSVTDDIFAIRRAFQEAEKQGAKSVDLGAGGHQEP